MKREKAKEIYGENFQREQMTDGMEERAGSDQQEERMGTGEGKDWQGRCEELEREVEGLRRDAAIDGALLGAGARNPRCLRALLDPSKLRFEEEGIGGLQEQIDAIREREAYLFYPENKDGCYGWPPAEAADAEERDGFLTGFGSY